MKRRRGLTLIEVLVATAVMGVVTLALVGVFTQSTLQWNSQVGAAEGLQEANAAADAMAKEIANGVQWNPGNTLVLPASTDSSGNYMPNGAGGPNPTYSSGTQVQYYLSNAQGTAASGTYLWRKYLVLGFLWSADSTWSTLPGGKAKYPNVSGLSFTNGPPPQTVQLSVTVSTVQNGKTVTYTATRNVYLSNHN